MQEHEYKARDKTVQKMSRDGLREKNLRSKKEKRITGRETDEKKTAGHREQELDFGKVRKTHTAEETVEGVKEGKHRLQSRHAFLEQEEIAEAEEMENSEMSDDKAGGEKSPPVSRSRLRKDSIRGHPERKFERDSEITEPDRQNRKKKMVTAYAAKEQKLYHEKAEVDEKSMEDFREEIKSKTKREQIRKEQKKSKSRLSFEDESKGVIPGSGMAKRGASAVSETVSDYSQKKVREDTDDNAALDAADQMELAGESLARKSIYVRERLKENRQRNNRLKESVLEETEKFRLQFGTSASNEAKKAVQKEAEQKKQTALKKLLQKKRYQKQYQAAKQGKAVKDAVLVNAQRFTEKAKAAVKEIVAQNRNILLSIGVLVLLFALMVTSLSSQFAVYQLKKKPELRNLLFRTYEELAKDQIPVQMENYEQVYLGTMKLGETPEQIKKELEKKQPHNYKGHAVSTSDVLILNDEGVMTTYYVNKDTFIEISDFMKVISSESGGLTKDTVGYEIEGKDGTWEVIDYLLIEGKNYFLMEHEQYGKDVAYVVLDQNGNVLVDGTYNGFDDVVKQKILDSLHPPVQEQTEDYKPKLDNWQKYMENGEYLRSAEITEEANYNMIDGLKNNAAPKDKKNRQKESVLTKLNEKKEEVARRSGQKTMREVMGQDIEHSKK